MVEYGKADARTKRVVMAALVAGAVGVLVGALLPFRLQIQFTPLPSPHGAQKID